MTDVAESVWDEHLGLLMENIMYAHGHHTQVFAAAVGWPNMLERYRRARDDNGAGAVAIPGLVGAGGAMALPIPRGAFLHGSVGTGKTLLMDILGDLCTEGGSSTSLASVPGARAEGSAALDDVRFSARHINVVRMHMNEASYILHRRLGKVLGKEATRKERPNLAILAARRWRQLVHGRTDVLYSPVRSTSPNIVWSHSHALKRNVRRYLSDGGVLCSVCIIPAFSKCTERGDAACSAGRD